MNGFVHPVPKLGQDEDLISLVGAFIGIKFAGLKAAQHRKYANFLVCLEHVPMVVKSITNYLYWCPLTTLCEFKNRHHRFKVGKRPFLSCLDCPLGKGPVGRSHLLQVGYKLDNASYLRF